MKVSIKPSFVAYMLILLALSSYENCLGVISALLVHETAHYLVAKGIHEPIAGIEIAPFGGVMIYQAGSSPSKGLRGLLLAAAGPAGNYLFILLLGTLAPVQGKDIIRAVMLANLSMMIINLVPALPLDGGAALFSLGYYLFDVSRLIRVLSVLGGLTGAGLCAIGILGLLRWGILNLSFPIVGIHLMQCAYQCRERMLVQNLYTVIQEQLDRDKQKKTEPVRLYRISGDECLCNLITYISRAHAAAFMVEEEAGEVSFITGADICRAVLHAPYERVSAIIEKHPENAKNRRFSP